MNFNALRHIFFSVLLIYPQVVRGRNNDNTINIASVCVGLEPMNEIVLMIKSVLIFNKMDNITFHLVVDVPCEVHIRTAFGGGLSPRIMPLRKLDCKTPSTCHFSRSIIRPGVSFHFSHFNADLIYKWAKLEPNLTTEHHSGIGGLTSTFDFKIFPNLTRVIAVDSDAIFLSDVKKLWILFQKWGPDTVFSMARNDLKGHGNGRIGDFNYGIRLVNYSKRLEFDDKFRVEKILKLDPFVKRIYVAQIWYNSIISVYPEHFLLLPQKWNLQHCLSYNVNAKYWNEGILFSVGAIHLNCYGGNTTVKNKRFDYAIDFITEAPFEHCL